MAQSKTEFLFLFSINVTLPLRVLFDRGKSEKFTTSLGLICICITKNNILQYRKHNV